MSGGNTIQNQENLEGRVAGGLRIPENQMYSDSLNKKTIEEVRSDEDFNKIIQGSANAISTGIKSTANVLKLLGLAAIAGFTAVAIGIASMDDVSFLDQIFGNNEKKVKIIKSHKKTKKIKPKIIEDIVRPPVDYNQVSNKVKDRVYNIFTHQEIERIYQKHNQNIFYVFHKIGKGYNKESIMNNFDVVLNGDTSDVQVRNPEAIAREQYKKRRLEHIFKHKATAKIYTMQKTARMTMADKWYEQGIMLYNSDNKVNAKKQFSRATSFYTAALKKKTLDENQVKYIKKQLSSIPKL